MKIKCKPWLSKKNPKRILVMRFHALGDIIITLPYLASLKKNLPESSFWLMTRKEFSSIPMSLELFTEIISFDDHRNGKIQFIIGLIRLPLLWWKNFDVVIDLQNNVTSRFIRTFLFPSAWSEFDKSSKIFAADRARLCIDALGLGQTDIVTNIAQKKESGLSFLSKNKLDSQQYIVLNPCGAFSSRNWPLERYVDFARFWLKQFPELKFLVLGLNSLKPKVKFLKNALGDKLVDLCGQTSQAEAFGIIKKAKLVLTEDGSLMHMSWVQGTPTVAIFGSTAAYWSSPQGDWSICLNSSDLPCGNCLLEKCKYEDNHCLTRYSAEFVFEKSQQLLLTTIV